MSCVCPQRFPSVFILMWCVLLYVHNNTSYLIAWKFIEFYFFAITPGRYGTILKFSVQFFSFWCKKCRSWSSILLCDGCCTMGAWIFRILMVKRAYVRRYYFCFTWPASFKFLMGLYIFICADIFFFPSFFIRKKNISENTDCGYEHPGWHHGLMSILAWTLFN